MGAGSRVSLNDGPRGSRGSSVKSSSTIGSFSAVQSQSLREQIRTSRLSTFCHCIFRFFVALYNLAFFLNRQTQDKDRFTSDLTRQILVWLQYVAVITTIYRDVVEPSYTIFFGFLRLDVELLPAVAFYLLFWVASAIIWTTLVAVVSAAAALQRSSFIKSESILQLSKCLFHQLPLLWHVHPLGGSVPVAIRWCSGPLLFPFVSLFFGALASTWRAPDVSASIIAHGIIGACSFVGLFVHGVVLAPLLYSHDAACGGFAHLLPYVDDAMANVDIAVYAAVTLDPRGAWLSVCTIAIRPSSAILVAPAPCLCSAIK